MDDARCRDFLIEEMEMGVAKCIDCSVGLVDTRMRHDQNDFWWKQHVHVRLAV